MYSFVTAYPFLQYSCFGCQLIKPVFQIASLLSARQLLDTIFHFQIFLRYKSSFCPGKRTAMCTGGMHSDQSESRNETIAYTSVIVQSMISVNCQGTMYVAEVTMLQEHQRLHIRPVSYTHLDVYKRQDRHCVTNIPTE